MTDQVFHEYLQLSRLLINKLNSQLTTNELYHSQWLITNYLKNFGSSTLVEISHYLHVEKSAVTRTVNRLEKKQLIQQVPGNDKREKRIMLTDKGEEMYTLGSELVHKIEQNALQGISQEEQEQFFTTLRKIKNNVNE
ncbi:MarR family transcriptional regulator [Bacillus sp. B190/17]|uniref:MarR family transcriptional regulator n=1 Tax=Bacillus lumedeiriae TaxID=3058829 RepID=A0ABW8I5P5_9BACI